MLKAGAGTLRLEKISLTTPHLALCKQAKALSESQSKTARLINHLHYASFSPVDELVFKVRRHSVGYLDCTEYGLHKYYTNTCAYTFSHS